MGEPQPTALGLRQDELKALEQTRTRLSQLSKSLGSLKEDIYRSNPLPTATSLQTSTLILQQNLKSLLELTNAHGPLFQRLVVHPSTNFPGRTHENILVQLLRKKLEPDIEDAAAAARAAAAAHGITDESFFAPKNPGQRRGGGRGYGDEDDDEDEYDEDDDDEDDDDEDGEREPKGLGNLWKEAGDWTMERVAEFVQEEATDPYTKEEREMGVENVRTGLKRDLESDEESDEDEDEDDEMGGTESAGAGNIGAAPQPPQPPQQQQQQPLVHGLEPEVLMWFAARGDANAPPYLEYESKKQADGQKKR